MSKLYSAKSYYEKIEREFSSEELIEILNATTQYCWGIFYTETGAWGILVNGFVDYDGLTLDDVNHELKAYLQKVREGSPILFEFSDKKELC